MPVENDDLIKLAREDYDREDRTWANLRTGVQFLLLVGTAIATAAIAIGTRMRSAEWEFWASCFFVVAYGWCFGVAGLSLVAAT